MIAAKKMPIATKKTEIEQESQTDFAPLEPAHFSLDGLNQNYDTNLMFVQEEPEGALGDFSITG